MMEAQHVVKNQKALLHNDEEQTNYLYHCDVFKSPTNPSGVPNFHLQIPNLSSPSNLTILS
jgi:hypothetical protein